MDNIFVTRASMPPMEEYIEEIKSLWDSHIITNRGEKERLLENKLIEYLDVPHMSLMVNGHMALELAIQALDLKGEVITTPFTFASTTHAIVRNNLKPVFCDIEPETYTIDVAKIEELITDRTSAIVPVHVYGNICDIEGIEKIAKKYQLKVIYDAAHAFGETYRGRGVGSYGDASIFSFHATKVFNTIEGGAVCYNEEDYGRKLHGLRNFGIRGQEVVDAVGANAKMNEFQAAMGLCNLRHVEEDIEHRKKVFDCYNENLRCVEGLKLPQIVGNDKHNYAYYPILVDDSVYGKTRDELFDFLKDNRIYSRKYFYPLTNEFDCYKEYESAEKTTPTAYKISKMILTLPIYPEMNTELIEHICSLVRS